MRGAPHKVGAHVLAPCPGIGGYALPAFRAVTIPGPPQEYVFLAWFIGAVISIVALLVGLVTIWDKVRSKPPTHAVYATKEELRLLGVHVDVEVSKTNGNVENVEKRAKTEMLHLEDRILKQIGENRSNSDHRFGEISGKVDGISQGMQQLSNDLFRAVGVLEGTTRKAA